MKLRDSLAAAWLAAALAGCGHSDISSLMLDGADTALTLERIKPYAWSDEWELQFTVRRNPDCQRRHKLKPSANASPKLDVYSPAPGVFILREGKRWYVTDLKSCELQAFKEQPPEPGTPVGAFVEKNGAFTFAKAP